MGIAAWLMWRRGGFAAQRKPLGFFLIQLAMNTLWTPLFFGLKNPALHFAKLVLLWLAILATGLALKEYTAPPV